MKTLLQHRGIATSSTRSRRYARAIFGVAVSLVASCAVVSRAQEAAPQTPSPQVDTSVSANAPLQAPVAVASAINVLLVPIDEITAKTSNSESLSTTLAATTSTAITSTSTTTSVHDNSVDGAPTENVSPSSNVGPAERAAAPLRRAFVRLGYSDVLTAAPRSSVLRRAVEEKRLPQNIIDDLSGAMRLVSQVTTSDESATSSTRSEVATTATTTTESPTTAMPTVENSAVTPPVVPPSITMSVVRSASVSDAPAEMSSARRKAIAAASSLGKLLGYRAVVAFSVVNDSVKPRVVFLLVDSLRESGVVVVPTVAAANGRAFSLAAADLGSTLLQSRLGTWEAFSATDKSRLAENGIVRARALMAAGEAKAARDEINAALALDPKRNDVLELLGDILLKSGDTNGAVATYRRVLDAADANAKGAAWAKIAQAYVAAKNWPETLIASEAALAQNADSSDLRLAMAEAQLGRARLFLAAERGESATFALEEAEKHLARTASLAPNDARVMRLQVQQLTLQNRTREALSLLDRVALQFPDDGELQANYASALLSRAGREADAFRAWTRAWNVLSNNGASPANETLVKLLPSPDRLRFRRLSEGFDLAVGDAAKGLYSLTERVLEGAISREDAILQARAPLNLVVSSGGVLKALSVPDDRFRADYLVRIDAGDKMTQAVAAYSLFLENGDENFRDSALELHKAAVAQINALRAAQ